MSILAFLLLMRRIAFLLLCLAFVSQGRRGKTSLDEVRCRPHTDNQKLLKSAHAASGPQMLAELNQSIPQIRTRGPRNPLKVLAMLFLAFNPIASFKSSAMIGVRLPSSRSLRGVINSRLPGSNLALRPRRFGHQMPAMSANPTEGQVMSSEQRHSEASDDELTAINRGDFPILETDAYPGKPLIYLDSGASSQKPIQVLEAMDEYYRTSHANVHRGAHSLSIRATEAYEKARDQVKTFINAERREEIVFTQGATDAINIVAFGWGQKLVPGDEIILSVMEHHSNLVPWQLLAERTGAVLKFARLTEDEMLDTDHLISLMNPRTKIVSIVHVSNTLGCINPIKRISQEAHKLGAVVVVDACQSVPHMPVDVRDLECDFLAASGHKMCGPTGIGFLYGKYNVLKEMPPVRGGGEMIDEVELEKSTYLPPPARFEAGTPAVAEAIGLGAACEYLQSIGMERIYEHEKMLGNYLYNKLNAIPGIRIYGPKVETDGQGERAALVAFNHKDVHASDLSFFLDQEGVAIRVGHHCTQPLHKIFDASGSARASCYFYNSKEDIDTFIEKLKSTITMFEKFNE